MTWYACWGSAALHPTMGALAAPASLLAPAVQVVQLARGQHTEGLVTAVGSMVLFGLVLARLNGLAGEVAALAAELHDGPIQRLTGAAYAADLSRRRLARAQETVLYRVAQEALTNVVKHAHAGHAQVLLQGAHGQVTLQVADDGTGFVTAQVADPIAGHLGLDHFGLASMRQQLEMAGGSWQVHSRPGYGTTVTATLPLAMMTG
ncbi:MAG TPA: ATP-binding protein [Actinomycetes bacterium]|nr:ATP-binding protein [Actinomycetes bacterium]